MNRYTLASVPDFYAIYENGKLVLQDNFIDVHDVASALDWGHLDIEGNLAEHIIEDSTFPSTMKELIILCAAHDRD